MTTGDVLSVVAVIGVAAGFAVALGRYGANALADADAAMDEPDVADMRVIRALDLCYDELSQWQQETHAAADAARDEGAIQYALSCNSLANEISNARATVSNLRDRVAS